MEPILMEDALVTVLIISFFSEQMNPNLETSNYQTASRIATPNDFFTTFLIKQPAQKHSS